MQLKFQFESSYNLCLLFSCLLFSFHKWDFALRVFQAMKRHPQGEALRSTGSRSPLPALKIWARLRSRFPRWVCITLLLSFSTLKATPARFIIICDMNSLRTSERAHSLPQRSEWNAWNFAGADNAPPVRVD